MPSEEKQWTMNRAGLVVKNLPGPVKLLVMLCLIVVGFNFLPSSSHRLNVGEEIVDTAIVVLGGGVAPDGDVPTHTRLRVDAAVNLYKSLNGQARVFPLSGGTPHKPNLLDAQGFPIWEAVAASRKLISLGIPPKHIYEEAFSLDTVGNVRPFAQPLQKSLGIHLSLCSIGLLVAHGAHSSRKVSYSARDHK